MYDIAKRAVSFILTNFKGPNQIKNKMQLLTEYYKLCENGICQDFLTENQKRLAKANGEIYLTGIIQEAERKNGNGRIYGKKLLEREVGKYQEMISERRAIGETDHPESDVVSMKNASHMVERCWWDGNKLMGTIRVMRNLPCGKILEGLLTEGVQLGISSRGLGTTSESDDGIIVEDDFQLICFDIVQEPSTRGAFLAKEHKELRGPRKESKILQFLKEIVEK